MSVLLAGILMRLIPGVGFLFVGTALAGAAIATGNVLVPVMVRRDFSRHTGVAMAVYSTALIGFAALAAGVTVPLANALGGGWRPGLAVWAIPAAIGVAAWLPLLLRRVSRSGARASGPVVALPLPADPARRLLRSALAWQVTLFFALQSAGFYATLAWLPSIFHSHGASESTAGLLLSLSMVVGLATALTLPWLAARSRDQRLLVVVSCMLMAAGLLGILLAPMSAPYLWTVLLGLGQNAAFPLALMLIVLRAGSIASTEGLSTMAQGIGYTLAALGPVAVGALHQAAHSWTPSLILLVGLVLPQLLIGLAAGRDRRVAE
jgi:CP family cyanate transporter-like MFS transporter